MKQFVVLVLLVAFANARNIDIIGGENAQVGAWPFMASLQLNGEHSCGGSLVSAQWVLCAAHCTESPLSSYTVVLGMHNRLDFSVGGPEVYTVTEIISHEDYTLSPLITNDVSLVRLDRPANLGSRFIEVISMVDSGDDNSGQRGTIIGWGIDTIGGQRAVILQQAAITVHQRAYCLSFWEGLIDPGQICLGEPGQSGACSSDSGGPLIVNGKLAGITSWVQATCNPNFPSVYESVAYHRQWIRNKIGV